MKKVLLLATALFFTQAIIAQDYFDIFKYSYNKSELGNVDNDAETDVSNTNIEFYFPLPVSAQLTFIGGFTYENTRLGLGFNDDRSNLIMTRLNLGVKLDHGNGWSGTYVALPKLASDFDEIGSDDFQMGGLALLEKRYNSRLGLKYGAYVSSENFGTTITPLVGLWYKSDNKKFTINSILPIRTDINYSLTDHLSVGLNVITSIKSYNLAEAANDFYVQEESIRAGFFGAYGFMDNSLILRGKVGFDTTDYGLYAAGDTVGAQLLTAQLGGDDRTRLNSEFDSSLYFGIDLIYRTDL